VPLEVHAEYGDVSRTEILHHIPDTGVHPRHHRGLHPRPAEEAQLEMDQEGQGGNGEKYPAPERDPAGISDGKGRPPREQSPGQGVEAAYFPAGDHRREKKGGDENQRGEQPGGRGFPSLCGNSLHISTIISKYGAFPFIRFCDPGICSDCVLELSKMLITNIEMQIQMSKMKTNLDERLNM